MFRYCVKLRGKTKVIKVDDKRALKDAIGRKFGVDGSQLTVKSWDNEFNVWVDIDVDDFTELPDVCTLRAFLEGERDPVFYR